MKLYLKISVNYINIKTYFCSYNRKQRLTSILYLAAMVDGIENGAKIPYYHLLAIKNE